MEIIPRYDMAQIMTTVCILMHYIVTFVHVCSCLFMLMRCAWCEFLSSIGYAPLNLGKGERGDEGGTGLAFGV